MGYFKTFFLLHFTLLLVQLSCLVSAKIYVAYYTSWSIYARQYFPSDIPFDKITHLNYAFANIDSTGKIIQGDSYADTQIAYAGDSWDTSVQSYMGNFWYLLHSAKTTNPNLKVIISVGGWSWSGSFSTVASTAATRQTFVDSVVAFLQTYPFDGVDLDWEYPVSGGLATNVYSPADTQNYNLLLAALRSALDTNWGTGSTRKILSIASAAGPANYHNLDLPSIAEYVDYVNLMAYDYRGDWSLYTGHHTPLYNSSYVMPANDPDRSLGDASMAVEYYLANGMPADKIVLGAAMYGHGWAGVNVATREGLFQPVGSIPMGTWDDGESGATGVFDYKDILSKIQAGTVTRMWDDEVKAPWVYSAGGLVISYDDTQSIGAKIDFVNEKNLAGIMCWDLSSDTSDYQLSSTIYTNLLAAASSPTPSPPTSSAPTSSSPTSSTSAPSSTCASSSSVLAQSLALQKNLQSSSSLVSSYSSSSVSLPVQNGPINPSSSSSSSVLSHSLSVVPHGTISTSSSSIMATLLSSSNIIEDDSSTAAPSTSGSFYYDRLFWIGLAVGAAIILLFVGMFQLFWKRTDRKKYIKEAETPSDSLESLKPKNVK